MGIPLSQKRTQSLVDATIETIEREKSPSWVPKKLGCVSSRRNVEWRIKLAFSSLC